MDSGFPDLHHRVRPRTRQTPKPEHHALRSHPGCGCPIHPVADPPVVVADVPEPRWAAEHTREAEQVALADQHFDMEVEASPGRRRHLG